MSAHTTDSCYIGLGHRLAANDTRLPKSKQCHNQANNLPSCPFFLALQVRDNNNSNENLVSLESRKHLEKNQMFGSRLKSMREIAWRVTVQCEAL